MNHGKVWRGLLFTIVLGVMAFTSNVSRGQDYPPPDPVFPIPLFHERPESGAFLNGDGSWVIFRHHEGFADHCAHWVSQALDLIPELTSQLDQHSSLLSKEIAQEFQRIVGRIEGRILGSFIRKGMTTQQVSRILGDDPLCLESGGQVGVVSCSFWRFYTYGVTVAFISDDNSVLRVDHVTFCPLLN